MKIDTGAHRFGVHAEHAASVAVEIARLPNLKIGLAYTVFASPAYDPEFTAEQYARFLTARQEVRARGLDIPYWSCATSAVINTRPDMYLNAVRSGHLLYGLPIPDEPAITMQLAPAARALKTRVLQTQWVQKGGHLGYERLVKAKRKTLYGVVPLGRVDGLTRTASANASVLVAGKRCRFIDGSLAGEHVCIDLTEVGNVPSGEEVVVWGEQGGSEIELSEYTEAANGEMAEIVMAFRHLERRYIGRSAVAANGA